VAAKSSSPPLGIAELATLGGVTRRTVRYYVQEGLLPAPRGVGRGDHYGPEHLDRLLRVKGLQERGRTLEEIRRELMAPPAKGGAPVDQNVTVDLSIPRGAWVRLNVAPGIEVHVASGLRLPPPGRLAELAALCRELFGERPSSAEEDSSGDGKE
jgi:DNA-binding transcriptional MerR regulator